MMRYDFGVGEKRDWLVGEDRFDDAHQGKGEAIFCQGNGYLGQRAALEESYAGQTRDLLVTGTFDRFDAGEVTELPNLPDLTNLQLHINGQRFAMADGNTENYRRVMDLQTGGLCRELIWTGRDGLRYQLRFERFVSMTREHVLGLRASITPLDGDAAVRAESGIDGRVTNTGAAHFHEGEKRIFDMRILRMISKTVQSEVTCCLSAAHRYTLNGADVSGRMLPIIDRRYMAMRGDFSVKQGQTLTIEKLCSVTTSRDQGYIGLADAAELAAQDGPEQLKAALALGYDALFEESAAAWRRIWDQADVRVASDHPFDQLLLRFALYHLNIMVKKDDSRVGIGAKGLTGEGYKGHSFWDTEIFILPYFVLTQPDTARTLLEYRYQGLPGARRKAWENGFEGAMYPWEAAWVDDGEVTPLWGAADVVTGKQIPILTGMIEQHITADVAFAVRLYQAVTGDMDFMRRCGYEIILDTARFWASRVTWDEGKNAYVICDVIGPDEYKEHVDNNAYTNYMADHNLRLALEAMDDLRKANDEACRRLDAQFDFSALRKKILNVRSKLYLPRPDENGIVAQFDGYMDLQHIDLTPYKQASVVGTIYNDYNNEQISSFQVHKQADTLVLMLLLEDLFDGDTKRKNYEFYESRTLHDSSLSKSTHCVLAADLNLTDTAYRFFEGCGGIDLGPNMGTSDMGVHTASMGGIWQCAVYGFGGVRVVGDQLHIAPRLPDAWQTLEFQLIWQGRKLRVTAARDKTRILNLGSKEVQIIVSGAHVVLPAGGVYDR
ncbi:MAG: glycoside hydrolase family 65 protein [Clostridia bacterium]|nr:glycoside hydrolase family 65 protein [Clostridia bacterium]